MIVMRDEQFDAHGIERKNKAQKAKNKLRNHKENNHQSNLIDGLLLNPRLTRIVYRLAAAESERLIC